MSRIIRSAYLKVDESHYFATIVFKNGKETQRLATKRQALEIGEAQIGLNLNELEWKAVREQIHSSKLISRDRHLERISNEMQADLDEFKRQIEIALERYRRESSEGDDWKRGG